MKTFRGTLKYAVLVLSLFFCMPSLHLHALSQDEENNIWLYRELSPGVVNVSSTTVPLEAATAPLPSEGSGSGFVINKGGDIVTNFHVIAGAEALEITLYDGSKWEPEIIGVDQDNDIALLNIKAPAEKLVPIPLGDSSGIKVGQKVLAIGNPFGLDRTLTVGIVSSLGRTMSAPNEMRIRGVVQTDAAINPGNSGGPMLDGSGKVIGVNTALFSPVAGSVGIGFAIPVNTLKKIIPQLLERGYVIRPWLGMTGPGIGKNLAEILKLPSEGVLVADVLEGGSAAKAGLKGAERIERVGNLVIPAGGDLIVAVDGRKVKNMDDIDEAADSKAPGKSLELSIYRNGKRMNVKVPLFERPRE